MPDSPRSSTSTRVQDAAWEIFLERGLPRLTMEQVASRAGVAKTTVYRWWPTKSAVLLDALKERLIPLVAFPDTGDVRDDIVTQLEAVIGIFASEVGRAYIALVAESVHDADVAVALRDGFVRGQRRAAIDRLEQGVRQGQLPRDVDLEILVDSLYGALYYRVLVAHSPLELPYAKQLVDGLWPSVLRTEAHNDRRRPR